MDEEQRATLLADWLNGPAGSPPPAGLDDETLSAVYALSPGRAPSPRVSEADILTQVTEGPFATAAPTAGEVIGFPLPGKKSSPARRARPSKLWWAFPGIGMAMAAAAAVVILVPALNRGSVQEQMYEAARSDAAPPAAPPPPPPVTLPEMGPPTDALAADTRVRERANAAPATAPATTAAPAAPMPMGGASAVADVAGPAPSGGLAAPAASAALDPGTGADRGEARRPADKDERPVTEEEATGGQDGYARFESDDADARLPAEPAKAAAEGEEQKKKSPTRSVVVPVEDTPAAAARKNSAPAAAPAPVAQGAAGDLASATATGSSARESRAPATPLDYEPGWFRKYADVVPTYQEAAAKEAAGDWAAAVALYRPLVADARTDLAQDAAWRGARALWAQGRSSEAMAMVTAGLKRSTEGTVFRVQLLVLQGDLLNTMGKPVDAVRAWDEAADLNRER